MRCAKSCRLESLNKADSISDVIKFLISSQRLSPFISKRINAKNAFATNVAGSTQQDAKFVITDKSGTMAVNAPTMNINASNDFGNVEFDLAEAQQYGGATLTINVAEGVNVSFKSFIGFHKVVYCLAGM